MAELVQKAGLKEHLPRKGAIVFSKRSKQPWNVWLLSKAQTLGDSPLVYLSSSFPQLGDIPSQYCGFERLVLLIIKFYESSLPENT